MPGEFSDVPIAAAAPDRCLDEADWILPGLDDAGDRLFCPKQPDAAAVPPMILIIASSGSTR